MRVSGVNWEYWELFASLEWKIYGQTVLHHPVASKHTTFIDLGQYLMLSIVFIKVYCVLFLHGLNWAQFDSIGPNPIRRFEYMNNGQPVTSVK